MEKIQEIIKLENQWEAFIPHYQKYRYGHKGLCPVSQENLKSLSWPLMKAHYQNKDFVKAAYYLLHGVITAHYWRARKILEINPKHAHNLKLIVGKKYYPGYLLDIDHYTCHWLGANEDRLDLFPPEVIESLSQKYGYQAEKCKYLPKGMSIYQGFFIHEK